MKRVLSLKVSPEIGNVSGEYTIPDKPTCIMTLAHGAGAGMHHPFMAGLAQALAEAGVATLRFNFPFTEGRKGRPDAPAVAHQTISAAAAHAHAKFPHLPLFLSGKSFGGRMSSQYLSEKGPVFVKGIIFFGFPLHPVGKPSTDRAEHLKNIKVPMLFLQGSKDALATWELIASVCATLKKATLVKIEGADHSFKAGKINTMEILVSQTESWLKKKIKS